jgi:hypothetical protein
VELLKLGVLMVWTCCNVSRHCALFLGGRNVIIGCVDGSDLAECVQTLGINCSMHIDKIVCFDGVDSVQCVQTLSNYFWQAGML